MQNCPCGSSKEYAQCCEIYHNKTQQAPTAESLMRARYSAFVKDQIDYVGSTHKPGTTDFDPADAKRWANDSTWKGLEIVSTSKGREADNDGIVEFKASYTDVEGNDITHHEISQFEKIDGKWFYAEGQIVGAGPIKRATPKVGRNEPCPCGSGKKYKKCCALA